MLYSLTDKLKFDEQPEIEIKGEKISVKNDALTVLKLLDVINTSGELEATLKTAELLFSKKDQERIRKWNLSFKDYNTLLETAVSLALGEDPDSKKQGEE